MTDLSQKVEVFTSYDNIRLQVINLLLSDLGLSETDLHRGTFVSYIIDILAFLTSNLMFYSGMSYQEAFMTLAQLPESVYNLAAFLGYKPKNAIPCECDILIQIPLGNITDAVTVIFQEGHNFYAGNVVYKLKYKVEVSIDNENSNYSVTVIDAKTGTIYNLPYVIQNDLLSFTVNTIQQDTIEFEFITDPTLQLYTFTRYNIDFDEQLSDIDVYVDDVIWTEFDSVYLMKPYDQGYVCRLTESGAIVMFGNGIFGKQPSTSSKIKIIAYVTLGEDGKVVAGAIKQGDRIYFDTPQGRKQLIYTCTNPSSSIGGRNVESIDDVRQNALINMQAQRRLVSRYDYSNFATITDLPFYDSLSVLKRSDLKCNEIALFTSFIFFDEIIPTRTIRIQGALKDMHLFPLTSLTYDNEEYYNLFEYIPQIKSRSVTTYYYANSVLFTPDIVSANLQNDDIVITKGYINVDIQNQKAIIELYAQVDDIVGYIATIRIRKDDYDYTFNMLVDANKKKFYIELDLVHLPSANLQLYFKIYNSNNVQVYYLTTQQIIKQSLEEVCFSNFIWLTDYDYITDDDIISYLVPVVKKDWYDNLTDEEKTSFNTTILNKFVSGSTNVYRMTNSSINIQFGNTYGRMTNMKYNDVNYTVKNIKLTEPPLAAYVKEGDLYVVAGLGDKITNQNNPWYGHEREIAQCTNTNPVEWSFINPPLSSIILCEEDNNKYIWNGTQWFNVTLLSLPLTIELEIYVDPELETNTGISEDVKNVLYEYFSSQFGLLKPLFRAEIVRVAQSVEGVVYCRVIKPEFDIFFNFKISKLSDDDLFEFVPDYIYFTLDNIHITTNVYSAKVDE